LLHSAQHSTQVDADFATTCCTWLPSLGTSVTKKTGLLEDEILRHSYELAKILMQKYNNILRAAFATFIAGGFCAIVVLTMKVIHQ
jgi:hypothetical protein